MSKLTSGPQKPLAHKSTHATGGTDAITPADIGAAADSHAHAIANVTGLQTALDSKASTADLAAVAASIPDSPDDIGAASTGALAAVAESIPDSPDDIGAAPASHTHAIAEVTGLQVALDAKASTAELQAVAAGIPDSPEDIGAASTDALAAVAASIPDSPDDVGAAPASHTHTAAQVTDFDDAAAAAAPVQSVNGQTGDVTIGTFDPTDFGALEGGTLVREGGTAAWRKGLGFNAHFVASAPGPYAFADGDSIEFFIGASRIATINSGDAVSLAATTATELAAKVNGYGFPDLAARVTIDGRIEFYRPHARTPDAWIFLQGTTGGFATLGFSGGTRHYGSGATPGAKVSTDSGVTPFAFVGGESLTVETETGSAPVTGFANTDTDASAVVSRISAALAAAGLFGVDVRAVGGSVHIIRETAKSTAYVKVTGTAATVLGIDSAKSFGDGGAYDEEALDPLENPPPEGGGGGGGGTFVLSMNVRHNVSGTDPTTDGNTVTKDGALDFTGANGRIEASSERADGTGGITLELYNATDATVVASVVMSGAGVKAGDADFSFPAGMKEYHWRAKTTGSTTTGTLWWVRMMIEF